MNDQSFYPAARTQTHADLALQFGKAAAADLLFSGNAVSAPAEHLEAAAGWLKRAHDRSPDDGVSWGYSLKGGWRPSYRETSGYIVETLFDLSVRFDAADCRARAITIAHWLCRVQNEDGSISEPRFGSRGIVFDTGQVLLGFVRAYEETRDPAFLQAAERAGRWLAETTDADGLWTRNTHLGAVHVYNTRVSWVLLRLEQIAPQPAQLRVARANLDWALTQQRAGLFENCAFTPGLAPFTHTIAYTLRGLLESALLLNEPVYMDAAIAGAEAVLAHLRADGFLPGQIDVAGQAVGSYCCLTGNCQMAIVWLRLARQAGTAEFRQAADRSLRYVMAHQDIQTADLDLRGGIKGSQPIWGRYAPLSYPNWAAKFFIDALLLSETSPKASEEGPCQESKFLTASSIL